MKKLLLLLFSTTFSLIINSQNVNHDFSFGFGSSTQDEGRKVKYDVSGNIYLTGVFTGTIDIDPSGSVSNLVSVGGSDIFLAKYDPSGQLLWGFRIGNASGENQVKDLAINSLNEIIIVGDITGSSIDFDPGAGTTALLTTPSSQLSSFVAKYSSAGNLIFVQNITPLSSGFNQVFGVAVDGADNIYMRGYFSGAADFDPTASTFSLSVPSSTQQSIYFSKYSSSGSLVYAKALNNAGTSTDLYNADISVNASGEVLIVGAFETTAFDLDPSPATYTITRGSASPASFIAKYDVNGDFSFGFAINGASARAKTCALSNSGEIYIAGNYYNSLDLDPSSAIYYLHMTPSGGPDIYLAKYSSSGAFIWARSIGGTFLDIGEEIILNGGNVYLCGSSSNACDFESNYVVYNTNANGVFVGKYQDNGSLLGAFGLNANYCYGMDISSTGKLAITGSFFNPTMDTDPGVNSNTLTNNGSSSFDVFFGQYTQTCEAPPAPTFTTPLSRLSVCANNTTTLTAASSGTITWYSSPSSTVALASSFGYQSTTDFITSSLTAGTHTFYAEAFTCTNSATRSQITVTVNPGPTLSVTATPTAVCPGTTATLVVGGANSYTWSTNSNMFSIVVSPTTSTTYSVTGLGFNSCRTTTVITVNTTSPPSLTISPSSPAICSGETMTLSVSGANTYTWNNSSNSTSISVSPTSNTSYTVTGRDLGNCSNTSVYTVTVNSIPTVSITASSTSICEGESLVLLASGANSYTWNGTAGVSSITVSPTSNTTYTLLGTDINNCSDTELQNITVNVLPTLTITPTNNAFCIGQTNTLTASGASTYTWSTNDNTSGIIITPTISTNYTLSGTSTEGCRNSITYSVNPSVAPSLTVTSSNGNSFCSGNNTVLEASGADTYSWNNGVITYSNSVSPINSATYTVIGTNSLTACSSSYVYTISVIPLPNVSVSSSSNLLCVGETATLTATGANTYTWSNGTNSSQIIVNPSVSTSYTLVGSDNTCEKIIVYTQNVSTCTDINEQSTKSSILVFPNPNNGIFYLISEVDMELQIINELGQHIKSVKLNQSNNFTFEVTDLESGVYFLVGKNYKNKLIVTN